MRLPLWTVHIRFALTLISQPSSDILCTYLSTRQGSTQNWFFSFLPNGNGDSGCWCAFLLREWIGPTHHNRTALQVVRFYVQWFACSLKVATSQFCHIFRWFLKCSRWPVAYVYTSVSMARSAMSSSCVILMLWFLTSLFRFIRLCVDSTTWPYGAAVR